jgi:hypothetical protein
MRNLPNNLNSDRRACGSKPGGDSGKTERGCFPPKPQRSQINLSAKEMSNLYYRIFTSREASQRLEDELGDPAINEGSEIC